MSIQRFAPMTLMALMALMALVWTLPIHAQTMEEGPWKVLIWTPGGELAEAVYEVKHTGGSMEATMKWASGDSEIMDLHLDGDRLSFAWDPSFYMVCRFVRDASRQFKGACQDERQNLGPGVIAPPGTEVSAGDIDIDKAFELWNVSKEKYLQERYPQPSSPRTPDVPEPEPLPSRIVEVDGRGKHLVEVGTGEMTVVLESGIGDDHQVWRSVQQALGDHARVVSYDRAGLGLSEATSSARTPLAMADELHDLLEAAGYAPPYVLVGHQAGAFTVRAFEARFPEDVIGLVLVDPSHPDEDARYAAVDAEGWEQYIEKKSAFFSMISGPAAREFQGYVDALQDDAFPATGLDRPVIVLSGQRPAEVPRWIGESEAGLKAKKMLHQSLADELNGEFVESTQSTSYLQFEDPDLVIEAVKKILAAIEE